MLLSDISARVWSPQTHHLYVFGLHARLVELLNRVSRRFRWREVWSLSGVCLLSAVVLCLLPPPPSGVCHFQCPFHPDPPSFPAVFVFLDPQRRSPFSARASRFLNFIPDAAAIIPTSCGLRPGATRRAILLHSLWIGAAVLAFAACIARSRA